MFLSTFYPKTKDMPSCRHIKGSDHPIPILVIDRKAKGY